MAKSAGFTCDVCGAFAVGEQNGSSINAPDHWLIVGAHVRLPGREGNEVRGTLDVCSDICLATLGKERWEAEHEGRRFNFNIGKKIVRKPKGATRVKP